MANERADLTTLAGRDLSERADTRRTRDKLVEALRQWVTMHGAPPQRLAEVAELAGVSNATAYRHFASLDDVIQAVVLELPVRAVELFETTNTGDDPLDAFRQWNRCWVEGAPVWSAAGWQFTSGRQLVSYSGAMRVTRSSDMHATKSNRY